MFSRLKLATMKNRILRFVVAVAVAAVVSVVAPDRGLLVEAAADATVYVTKTGNKYHRATCKHLTKSKIEMPLSKAKAGYTACSVCNPPK